MPARRAIPARARRRGFILPLVVMVTTMIALVIALVLGRQSTHWLSIKRQLNDYEVGHGARGLEEALTAWITSGQGARQSFRDRVAADGRLLEITLPDGLMANSEGPDVITIYVEDAQGVVLRDFTGLSGEPLKDARKMLGAIKDRYGTNWAQASRVYGDIPVSVWKAPTDILYAIAEAVVGSSEGAKAIDEILKAREERDKDGKDKLTAQSMVGIFTNAGLQPEAVASLTRALTAEPTLWKLRVDIHSRGELADVFDGMFYVPGSRRGADRNTLSTGKRGEILFLDRRVK